METWSGFRRACSSPSRRTTLLPSSPMWHSRRRVTRLAQAPFALTVAVAFPSSLLLAGIVVAILLTSLDAQHPDGMPSLRWLTSLRIPIWVTVAAIVVCALGGYFAHAPTAERTLHPARMFTESLTPRPELENDQEPMG